MKVNRVYLDDKGESHFEVLIIELSEAGQIGRLSQEFPANRIIFRKNDLDYNYDCILFLKGSSLFC